MLIIAIAAGIGGLVIGAIAGFWYLADKIMKGFGG